MQRGIIVGAESNIASAVRHLLDDVLDVTWDVYADVSDVNSEVLRTSKIVVFNFLEEDDSLNKLLSVLRLIPSNRLVVFGYVDETIFIDELHKIGVKHYLPFNSPRSNVSEVVSRVVSDKVR